MHLNIKIKYCINYMQTHIKRKDRARSLSLNIDQSNNSVAFVTITFSAFRLSHPITNTISGMVFFLLKDSVLKILHYNVSKDCRAIDYSGNKVQVWKILLPE